MAAPPEDLARNMNADFYTIIMKQKLISEKF